MKPNRLAVAALFLLSGAAGLLYEVVWSRQLARVLGGSYPAIVATVSAFLGGLALGAALGGRFAARVKRPLRAYALLELGVGAYCAAFPLVLAVLHPVFGWCYRSFSDSPALATTARFLVAGAALLPPTIAMGATLPILVRAVVGERGASMLGGTGLLYGINTLGAAGGALATGFVLIPDLGFSRTLLLGAAANAAVAAGAWLLDRGTGPSSSSIVKERTEAGTVPESPIPERDATVEPAIVKERTEAGTVPDFVADDPGLRRTLLAAAFVSGAGSMLCQLAWTRALILSFGATVHAFTLVASVFILGLGAGGLLAGAFARRVRSLPLLAAALLAAVGVAAWSSVVQVSVLTLTTAEHIASAPPSYAALLRWEALVAAMLVLLPALLMGVGFPVLVAGAAASGDDPSRTVGRVYSLNTLGVIVGSLLGGMVVTPLVGTRNALLLGTGLYAAAAAVVALRALPWSRGIPACAGLVALAAAGIAWAPAWPIPLLQGGAIHYARTYMEESRREGLSLEAVFRIYLADVLFHEEGRNAVTSVFRGADGNVHLRTNGKVDASTNLDMDSQRLLGHLPMLAHPDAKRVLVVGLGSGVSAAAVAAHGPAAVDVVEISPGVVRAVDCFGPWNGNIASRPGVRMLVEDGRTHVEHARETYDVIVSEPSNPFIVGVSDLFTVEYFRACRARLAPHGVLGVWMQTYGMSEVEFQRVLRTVESVFPSCSVWEMVPWQDYVILAGDAAPDDPLARILARPWPTGEAGKALAEAGIATKEAALARLFLGPEEAKRYAHEAEDEALLTDDRLQLEFAAPRAAFDSGTPGMYTPLRIEAIRSPGIGATPPGADVSRLRRLQEARNAALVAIAAVGDGIDPFSGKRHIDVIFNDPALVALVAPELPADLRPAFAKASADRVPTVENQLVAWILRGLAVERFREAREAGYVAGWVDRPLAGLYFRRGNWNTDRGLFDDAESDLRAATDLMPENPLTRYALALVEWKRARGSKSSPHMAKALGWIDEALRIHPTCEPALALRGSILDAAGRTDEAIRILRQGLDARPGSIRLLGSLGEILFARGRKDEGRACYERILAMDPGNAQALQRVMVMDREARIRKDEGK